MPSVQWIGVPLILLLGFVLSQPLCAQPANRDAPPPPDLADLSYGPHERNVLDLWKAPAAQPTPLVVYIHGGGFSAGSKANAPGTLVRALLKEGISVMSISYRLSPYEAASPITYLTKDDPPVYLFYGEARGPLPANARDGQGIHHINFGLRLKEQMNPLGIECIVRHADEGTDRDAEMVAFFNKRLVPARAK